MARAIEFDAAKARYKALLLFWQKGYQATSLPDLLAAMDISRSSFYAAFGCKRALFVACMDLFAERTQRVLLTARAEKTPLEALEFFFERHLSRPARGRASLGCMLVNTVLELAGVDDDASDRASRHLADTGVVVAPVIGRSATAGAPATTSNADPGRRRSSAKPRPETARSRRG